MICERIDLYAYCGILRGTCREGYLNTYVPQRNEELAPKLRPAVIVIAGGGYEMRSKRESEPVALRFLRHGYAAFVLDYEVKTPHPAPLMQACMAIKYLRENAARYEIDPEHISAIGFSAGGHLAACFATMFGDEEITSALHENAEKLRPDAVVLSYPVITMGEKTHPYTRDYITGNNPALRDKLSAEKRVTERSAPAFLWHTATDDCVPVENSLMMANAYRACGVPFELHVFEHGGHGLSLCNHETADDDWAGYMLEELTEWVPLALTWLKNRGFTVKSVK